ncbi:MAG: DUF1360 domain-containing protein [Candidatus Gracilibacteria bacterium]|nr:DUF1360 domain-containing protein [Candidatus Gracilibacteria bacterium]
MGRPFFKTAEDIWNGIFTLLFLLLFGMLVFWLNLQGPLPHRIEPFDFLLLSFATFRLIRLLTYDKITNFVRAYFGSKDHSLGRTIFELLICPWCSGIWSALLLIAIFTLFSFGWFFILLLSVAGFASFLQIVINSVSHYGEKSVPEKRFLDEGKRLEK